MRKLLLLLLLSANLGCATLYRAGRKRESRQPQIWVFRSCAHNVDHEVCECKAWHEEINAKSGAKVKVCQ